MRPSITGGMLHGAIGTETLSHFEGVAGEGIATIELTGEGSAAWIAAGVDRAPISPTREMKQKRAFTPQSSPSNSVRGNRMKRG